MSANAHARRLTGTASVLAALSLSLSATGGQPDAMSEAFPVEKLAPGYVRGDVVSYSYVPIRQWGSAEAIGKLPYLFEYGLMKIEDGSRLEEFHEENIRRIDLASKWSTVISLYPRHAEYRDEIINLMIRCFRKRELIILSEVWSDEAEPYKKVRDILDVLWNSRERTLTSPEGDTATGRQLINNILAIKLGDEGFCPLGTKGLARLYDDFNRLIRDRLRDGEKPFRHIRGWYNLISYASVDYSGCYAASKEDADQHGRHILPANTQCIGVDVYDYWFHKYSSFDPADLSIPRERVRARAREWHDLRTRFYPEGLQVRVCKDPGDPKTWIPECWNDTHALLEAIELAGAKEAMMWYIGLSSSLDASWGNTTYTTPIETMDLYYENIKAGPWVALSWWVWEGWHDAQGTQQYVDRTLLHRTPDHPEGIPYSREMLDLWHDEFVKSRMRMFNDVVYNQFRHLNGPKP